MGANRAMRRKQVREQIKDWTRTGQLEQVRRLTQNGISQKDLDDCYNKGHEDGYKQGTDKTLRTVYAGVVLELLDSGNSREEAISFLKGLDDRLIASISASEDIEEVFERTGIHLMLKEDFDRVREIEEVEVL